MNAHVVPSMRAPCCPVRRASPLIRNGQKGAVLRNRAWDASETRRPASPCQQERSKKNELRTVYLLGMVSALVGAAVALSYALPANEIETYYYTDAHYKNEVGYTFLSCQGGIYREGKTTRYKVQYKAPCTGNQRL